MDQIKAKKTVRRIAEARAALLKENPFFGHLSMGLKLACAPCKTACTDGNRLIFDPEFAEQLSDLEIKFVVLHEVLHCVLEHCGRRKNRLHLLYNIACDEVVNSTILGMWGITTFQIAGNEVMHQAPNGKEGRLYNAEEIYDMLLHNQEKTGSIAGTGIILLGASASNASGGTSHSNAYGRTSHSNAYGRTSHSNAYNKSLPTNSSGDTSGQSENDTYESSFDRHDLWNGISNQEQLRDEWDSKIKSAASNSKRAGNMPGNIQRIVDNLTKRSNLDWKQLLHDFLQFDEYDYSYLPPDRRFSDEGFFLPAYNINMDNPSARNIWVCVDTSGSISDEELSSAMAEVLDAMRQIGLNGTISFFDSKITKPVPFETENQFCNITPVGGGGTSFQIIFDYLKTELYPDLPRAILIFTDGYATYPEEKSALEVPVLWIISKGGNKQVPWGRVAEM